MVAVASRNAPRDDVKTTKRDGRERDSDGSRDVAGFRESKRQGNFLWGSDTGWVRARGEDAVVLEELDMYYLYECVLICVSI